MRLRATLIVLVASLLVSLPVKAFDASKYDSPTYNTPQVDKLIIQGPGSSGPVDGMSVSANGVTRSLQSWLYGLAYDATDDVLRARAVAGFNGDDAPALNAILTAQPVVTLRVPTGSGNFTLNLKTTVFMPRVNARLYGLNGPQGIVFRRDPTHTGSTLVIGSSASSGAGARAAVVEDIFFTQDGRQNWLNNNPGVFTLPNRLTGGQSHVELHGGQGARIKIGGYGAPYIVSVFGGAGNVIDTPFFYGGIWDPDHSGLQESIAQIRFTSSPVHGHGTSGRVRDGILYGTGNTEPRTYLVGNKSITSPRRYGPRYGILVESLEDGLFTGGISASFSESNIAIIPNSTNSVIQNIEIAHMNIDESNRSAVYMRRDSALYPIPNTVNVHDNTINGQIIGKYGIEIDGANGIFAVAKFKEHHNTYRAHLAASVHLTGVDGGQSDNNRLAGYNLSGNDTSRGGLLDVASGRFVGGITRNHFTVGDTTGGGPNADIEDNRNQWAYTDTTSGQGNTYAGIRLPFVGTQGGVRALNLGGGGLIFGGKPAQGSVAWTPVLTTSSGALARYAVVNAVYTRNPDSNWITAKAEISISYNGTGSGLIYMTLPATAAATGGNVGAGKEAATSGKSLQVLVPSGSATAELRNFDGTYPATNGSHLIVTVTYEAIP